MVTKIREYCEGGPVEIIEDTIKGYDIRHFNVTNGWSTRTIPDEKRLVIVAETYENGKGCRERTQVDLLDVIAWVKENKPELLEG